MKYIIYFTIKMDEIYQDLCREDDYNVLQMFLNHYPRKKNIWMKKKDKQDEFSNLVEHCWKYNDRKCEHGSNWIRLDIDHEISEYCKKTKMQLDEKYYDIYIYLILKGKSHFIACKYAKKIYDIYIY